jgi:hypothetical protein
VTDQHTRQAESWVVRVAVAVSGASMLIFGVWPLLLPRSFAALIDYPPYNEHLLHDVGAFQIGIGAALVSTWFSRDAVTVALVGFVVASGLHVVSHIVDQDHGGHPADPWVLGLLSIIGAVGLGVHLRRRSTRKVRQGTST